MTRYRFVTPTKKGPWRDDRRSACLDAVKAGLGEVDDWQQEPDVPPAIYLHPFVDIETKEVRQA